MRYCHFGVSPVNYSDSDLYILRGNDLVPTLTYLKQQDRITKSHILQYSFVLTEVRGREWESVYWYRMVTKFCSVTCLVSCFSDESKMKMAEMHPISS